MPLGYEFIKVGKILPTRERKSKYGAPPRGKTIYCEIRTDQEKQARGYNFFFIKAGAYNIPKGWVCRNGDYSICYKYITNTKRAESQFKKLLNKPFFAFNFNSLDEIFAALVMNQL